MPSHNTYHLTWVSLTLNMGYLFTAAPAKLLLWRSYPISKVRGDGREEQPHIQGAVTVQPQEGQEELYHVQGVVAVWVQESREELLYIQGQEGRW